jgi:Flp pilus assembly pilin Flp
MIKLLNQNEDAATSIEYALIASILGIAIAGAAGSLGTNLSALLWDIANNFASVLQ